MEKLTVFRAHPNVLIIKGSKAFINTMMVIATSARRK
jgi:hypothetical protein